MSKEDEGPKAPPAKTPGEALAAWIRAELDERGFGSHLMHMSPVTGRLRLEAMAAGVGVAPQMVTRAGIAQRRRQLDTMDVVLPRIAVGVNEALNGLKDNFEYLDHRLWGALMEKVVGPAETEGQLPPMVQDAIRETRALLRKETRSEKDQERLAELKGRVPEFGYDTRAAWHGLWTDGVSPLVSRSFVKIAVSTDREVTEIEAWTHPKIEALMGPHD